MKFTPTGSVTVAAQVLEAGDQDALIRFEVTDTGPTIPPEVMARLFVPYQQAQPGSDRPQGGSGLGLAITRQLAEMMGGTAGADAAPGGGNRFFFTVRLKKRELQAPPRWHFRARKRKRRCEPALPARASWWPKTTVNA